MEGSIACDKQRLTTWRRLARAALLAAVVALPVAIVPRVAFAAPVGGNYIATGHDMDYHCNYGDANECSYLKIVVDKLTAPLGPSPLHPILALDQSNELPTALANAGYTTAGEVVVADPSVATNIPAFTTGPLPNYSVIITASDISCFGCDNTSTGEANINARAADFATYFNDGGNILSLAGAASTLYYNYVPLTGVQSGLTCGSGCYSVTPQGTALGITDAMANCCATHNSFVPPTSPFQILETDTSNANAETIACFGCSIGEGGFVGVPEAPVSALLLIAPAAVGLMYWSRRQHRRSQPA